MHIVKYRAFCLELCENGWNDRDTV